MFPLKKKKKYVQYITNDPKTQKNPKRFMTYIFKWRGKAGCDREKKE